MSFGLTAWDHGHTADGTFNFTDGAGAFNPESVPFSPPFRNLYYIERIDNSV
jgi:hypothetical protein